MENFVTDIRHFGFMVDDAKEFGKTLSIAFPQLTPWSYTVLEIKEEEMVVGEPCKICCAIAYLGDICFELVQAVDSPNSYQAKAEKGLHHIAYVYKGDFEQEKQRLLDNGFVIDWAAHRNDGEEVYYFRPKHGGYVLEVNNDFDYSILPISDDVYL